MTEEKDNHTQPVAPTAESKTFILDAMLAVMAEVDFIEKDSYNKFGGYNYASERTIKETVRKALIKNWLVFQLSTDASPTIHTTEKIDNQGSVKSTSWLTLGFTYTLWHASGQSISGTFIGSGNAHDDKGSYAAVTGAIKYILTSLFLIPTGMDAESDGNDTERQASTRTSSTKPVTANDLKPKTAPPAGRPQSQAGRLTCPMCSNTTSVFKDKESDEHYCWTKREGCGYRGSKESFMPKATPPAMPKHQPVPDDEPPVPDDDYNNARTR